MEFRVITDHEIGLIHDASCKILAEVGVQVPHEEMKKLFGEAGAKVDETTERVRIPEEVVQDCLDKAGKEFTIYGRDRSIRAEFGHGTRNYNSIAGEAMWVDDRSMERRYTTIEDVRQAARLGDALGHVNVVGAMADPAEIPASYRCVQVAAEQLKNTTKPITFWFHDRASAKFVLELFSACAGSDQEAQKYPYAYPFLEPISPLRFPSHGIDLLFETCKWPLPVPVGPMAQAGSSAPVTLAGTLSQENAEILAGICVTQLIRPGTPVCYGGIPHAFDMRTTQMIFAGPEQALMAVAMTQMGKHYGLPVYINVGLTDSKIPDAQAGIEAGITLQLGALAGADIFGHLGICGVDQATSLAMLVFQNELIGYVERVMRRFDVNDESLAVDLIASVAPESGSFLAEMHTAEHFRDEFWFPTLLDREFFQAWADSGRRDMRDRCIEESERLLAEHHPEPLDKDTERELDRVVAAARKELSD